MILAKTLNTNATLKKMCWSWYTHAHTRTHTHVSVSASHAVCHGYRFWLAKWLACPPLTRQVVSLHPGRVIPKTIIKIVQTADLFGMQCVRVGV